MKTRSNRVILAGGSGFIGRSLARALVEAGYDDVVVLTRAPGKGIEGAREVAWDGRTLGPWAAELNGAAAVVNLAGKNVNCRYTRKNLDAIDRSRTDAVRVVAEAIARCATRRACWCRHRRPRSTATPAIAGAMSRPRPVRESRRAPRQSGRRRSPPRRPPAPAGSSCGSASSSAAVVAAAAACSRCSAA